jgi:hypothetical protein
MAPEIIMGLPPCKEGYPEEGIYIDPFWWHRYLNKREVWSVAIIPTDNTFTFLILSPDFSNEYTSNDIVDQTNEFRIAEFNRLISEHYPQDLDSVLKLQSEGLADRDVLEALLKDRENLPSYPNR